MFSIFVYIFIYDLRFLFCVSFMAVLLLKVSRHHEINFFHLFGLPSWLSGRVHLPMQETWAPSLILEDLTCQGATKPVHNYWACAPEPGSGNDWSPCGLEPVLHTKRSHCSEKPAHSTRESPHSNERFNTAKNKWLNKFFPIFLMFWNNLHRNHVLLKGLRALSHKTIWDFAFL